MEEKNTDKFLFPLSYDADLKETDDLKNILSIFG